MKLSVVILCFIVCLLQAEAKKGDNKPKGGNKKVSAEKRKPVQPPKPIIPPPKPRCIAPKIPSGNKCVCPPALNCLAFAPRTLQTPKNCICTCPNVRACPANQEWNIVTCTCQPRVARLTAGAPVPPSNLPYQPNPPPLCYNFAVLDTSDWTYLESGCLVNRLETIADAEQYCRDNGMILNELDASTILAIAYHDLREHSSLPIYIRRIHSNTSETCEFVNIDYITASLYITPPEPCDIYGPSVFICAYTGIPPTTTSTTTTPPTTSTTTTPTTTPEPVPSPSNGTSS